MAEKTRRFNEAAIQLDQSAEPGGCEDEAKEQRHYKATIRVSPEHERDHGQLPASSPELSSFADWKVAAEEMVSINWPKFLDCRRKLRRGEPGCPGWKELFDAVPELLGSCLSGTCAQRVWWDSADHQMVSFPWESLIGQSAFSFVRGTPPAVVAPRLPLQGPLRLAFIHDPADTDPVLISGLGNIPGIEIVTMTKDPRQALRRAALENFELVHLVTDAGISLSSEGILYLKREVLPAGASLARTSLQSAGRAATFSLAGAATASLLGAASFVMPILPSLTAAIWSMVNAEFGVQTCTPSELAEMFRGSRVTLLSLSPKKSALTRIDIGENRIFPSVFQSFAAFSKATVDLPSTLVPLGRLPAEEIGRFWPAFYGSLAKTNSLEESLAAARASDVIPAALFFRHRLRRQFVPKVPSASVPEAFEPQRIAVELAASRNFMAQIREIEARYDPSASKVTESDAFTKELERHKQLEDQLKTWTLPEA
jgi:hypothetical protein